MKYLRLFEDFDSYDPYELMIIPPNKKGEMLIDEIMKSEPNLNLVNDLIVLGANLDWKDAGNYGQRTALYWTVIRNYSEIARMLIGAGADVDVQDESGWTPLHWAAYINRTEITQMLIDAKADLNIEDVDSRTALHYIAVHNNRLEIARMLIDAGARIDIEDNEGKLPYELATTSGLKKLLKP
jgi:ankyrin repeat protein